MNIRISHDTNQRLSIVALVIKATPAFITGKTPRPFHRLTHDKNKIWYYTYVREQY